MDKVYFLNKIKDQNKEYIHLYDFSYVPEKFTGLEKLNITCQEHGSFITTAFANVYKNRLLCGKCNFDKRMTVLYEQKHKECIQESKFKYSDKFSYVSSSYSGTLDVTDIICPTHGLFQTTWTQHLRWKTGCPKCEYEIPRIENTEKLIEKAKIKYNNKFDYSLIPKLCRSFDWVDIICPDHGVFKKQLFSHAVHGQNCPVCTKQSVTLNLQKFIAKANEVHSNQYKYDKVVFETVASMVTITCPEHGDWVQRAGSHLQGNGCKKCHIKRSTLTKEVFIENARKVHGDTYDYSKVVYKGNKTPVEIICKKHGSFWLKPNSHLSTMNKCGKCHISKGEIAIKVLLEKYKLKYIREYKPITERRFRFDFYLPDADIFIEFHGQQHYRPIELFGGVEEFRAVCKRDKQKKKLIKDLGKNLVVLNYFHLNDDFLEEELVRRLKFIYRYWHIYQGKLRVFKNVLDVVKFYNVPMDIYVTQVENWLVANIKDFKKVF